MNNNAADEAKHDWLIEMLVNMVCYASAQDMGVISGELTNALVVVSTELDRPINLGEDLEYLPPKDAVILPFRSKRLKPEYEH